MSGMAYVKLGKASSTGMLHAAKTETLGDWSGPTAHCGVQLRTTVTRSRMESGLKCDDCRKALSLPSWKDR